MNSLRIDGDHAASGQCSDGEVVALVGGLARRLRKCDVGCQRRKIDAIGGHQNVHYLHSAVRLVQEADVLEILVIIEDAKSGHGIHTVKSGGEGRSWIA